MAYCCMCGRGGHEDYECSGPRPEVVEVAVQRGKKGKRPKAQYREYDKRVDALLKAAQAVLDGAKTIPEVKANFAKLRKAVEALT